MLFRQSKDLGGSQQGFIHDAVNSGLRLDCRTPSEYRQVQFDLFRDEAYSRAEVSIGNTRAVCVVRGELCRPFGDRPTEGLLMFNAKSSVKAEASGQVSSGDITRTLERCIRESESLDTESLCVVAGANAWCIVCDVVLLDYDGNALDACVIAALAALRAFRRPEVTAFTAQSEGGGLRPLTSVKVHSSEEREPLPLALHQTPLSVTMSLFKDDRSDREPALVADPSAAEELAQSGSLTYTFNAHGELCGMYKSGRGCGLKAETVLSGSSMAGECAKRLHAALDAALDGLDREVESERARRLESLRLQKHYRKHRPLGSTAMDVDDHSSGADEAAGWAGVDRNDPILSYGLVHSEVFTRNG